MTNGLKNEIEVGFFYSYLQMVVTFKHLSIFIKIYVFCDF
jgi:hypothetical protein